MQTIDQAFEKLNKSKFRSKFHLSGADKAYIEEKGMDTIRRHAEGFVLCRLSPAVIENDGKQTPTSGHPVFKAQHATATCCRGCLNKWYGVPKGVQLTEDQQRRIVNLIMIWIEELIYHILKDDVVITNHQGLFFLFTCSNTLRFLEESIE